MVVKEGKSLSEYILIACMVVVVATAAIVSLGTTLDQAVQVVLSKMTKNTNAAATAFDGHNGKGIGGIVPPPGANEVQVCFESGICANFPKGFAGGTAADAAGANGSDVSEIFANAMMQIALQLKEQEELTPELEQLLAELAAAGVQLAKEEQELDENYEEHCAKGSTSCTTENTYNPKEDESLNKKAEDVGEKKKNYKKKKEEVDAVLQKYLALLPPELLEVIDKKAEVTEKIAEKYTEANTNEEQGGQTAEYVHEASGSNGAEETAAIHEDLCAGATSCKEGPPSKDDG